MSNDVTMDKKYTTRNGRKARVLCTDFADEEYTVVAAIMCTDGTEEEVAIFTSDGYLFASKYPHDLDLIEVLPYADFKVDEPVMVRSDAIPYWTPRYFKEATPDGRAVLCWEVGTTSWTAGGQFSKWDECRRPTPEELSTDGA